MKAQVVILNKVMETLKRYLPLIILVIAGFFLLRMFRGNGLKILPQSQFSEVPYSDPLNQLRLPAFQSLIESGIAQTQAERDISLANIQKDVAIQQQSQQYLLGERSIINDLQARLRQFDIMEILGLKSEETELAKTGLQTELAKYLQSEQLSFNRFKEQSYLEQLQLYFAEREQDRQAQQAAINRYYSSRQTGQIIGSVGQALGSIFGNRQGGNVFGTPPTFPSGSSFGGSFGGFF